MMPGVGVGVRRATTEHLDVRHMCGVRRVWLGWIPARAATSCPACHFSRGASAGWARSKSVSCAAYLMNGITTYVRSPFGPRALCAGRTTSLPRVPCLRRSVVRWRGPRVAVRTLGFCKRSGHRVFSYLPGRRSLRMMVALASNPSVPVSADRGRAGADVGEGCYLVDPASSHMLVSNIKPCMCKYEQIQTVKLRMAH
ncbi:hypothetical protein RND71_023356 [Anisodus tanguticus]|uniref:Uncharacterized protein n=1 Tax=Anisodus tanguticus TaxID=243964 RepID=A0AAE1VBI1_9SOLA|nr:hypothetical protein RND71_023356 [Anisodus tanguticus]